MAVKYMGLGLLIISALVCDIKTYKIKNSIVIPFAVFGLLTGLLTGGPSGLAENLLGAFAPFVLLMLLYALRMLGAGDIKLFMAIGSIMGFSFVLFCMSCSFISGGIIALVLMLFRKNAAKRLSHLFIYLKITLLTLSFTPYTDFHNKSDGAKFHFSIAAACGTAITIILKIQGSIMFLTLSQRLPPYQSVHLVLAWLIPGHNHTH